VCTRGDYTSLPIPPRSGNRGSGIRSIILDHAYRIAAAHSASLDRPRAILGHSRDFHSSAERPAPTRVLGMWRSWLYRSSGRSRGIFRPRYAHLKSIALFEKRGETVKSEATNFVSNSGCRPSLSFPFYFHRTHVYPPSVILPPGDSCSCLSFRRRLMGI